MGEERGADEARSPPLAAALDLCRALRAAGVRFCHWKSNGHLDASLIGRTDLDVFVAPDDRLAFEAVLGGLGVLKIRSQPWARYPGIEDWLACDGESTGFLHLHVHYALLTGLKRVKHLRLPWEEVLLANLRHDAASGWPIPAAELELIVLLVRIWAKMSPQYRLAGVRIPRTVLAELDWLRADADEQETTRIMGELGLADEAVAVTGLIGRKVLRAGDVAAVARRLYRRLGRHRRMGWGEALVRAAASNGHMVLARAAHALGWFGQVGKTLTGGGAIIAFVGADGAGKSTLTRDIVDWLSYKLDVHLIYLGSGDGGTGAFDRLRRAIRAIVNAVRRKPGDAEEKQATAASRQCGLLQRLVQLHQLPVMRHKIKMLRRARRLAGQGSVIIADRYPQTQVRGINDGPRLLDGASFDWAAAREARLYQEAETLGPDLLIKLLIDAETALARKPGHARGKVERKCEVIHQLVLPQCVAVEIDSRRPYDEVLRAAKLAIWRALARA